MRLPPPRLLMGGALTGAVTGAALLSLIWTPMLPGRMHIALRLKPPLEAGLLGTDAFGRDIVSQLMTGAWASISIAMGAICFGAVLGIGLGLLAAAARGWTDEVLMRGADVLFAFPALISGLMIAALIGPGQLTPMLAIGFFALPVFLRLTRGAALAIWAQDYCLAAQAVGQGAVGITLRHVVPNIAGLLIVQITIQLGLAILVESGLSFIGLGPAPPITSWGRMLSESQTYLAQAPWMALAPGLTIALTVLGFNLLGDGFRDLLDLRRVRGNATSSDPPSEPTDGHWSR